MDQDLSFLAKLRHKVLQIFGLETVRLTQLNISWPPENIFVEMRTACHIIGLSVGLLKTQGSDWQGTGPLVKLLSMVVT